MKEYKNITDIAGRISDQSCERAEEEQNSSSSYAINQLEHHPQDGYLANEVATTSI